MSTGNTDAENSAFNPDNDRDVIIRDGGEDEENFGVDNEENGFQKLKTLPVAIFQILCNVVMIILVFLMPILCHGDEQSEICPISPFSILIYSHGLHWTIHLIADQFMKAQHKKNRLNGYLEFYLMTKNMRRTPFYIVSFGNAVLLITITVLHDYCDPDKCDEHNKYTKVDYLRGLITLECLVIMSLLFYYIMNVREFHAQQFPPDVLREDLMNKMLNNRQQSSSSSSSSSSVVIDENPKLIRDQVMEKQAELIRYLQSHARKLNQKILSLTQQLNQRY